MALTDITCRNATCPADKPRVRLADGGGLYLEVSPNRSKRWFWKYYFDGKEKRIALGHYTEAGSTAVRVNLNAAREARDDSRKLQRRGTDPAQHRQLEKLSRQTLSNATFESVARELHATKSGAWGPRYFERWLERMEKDLFPWIGSLPLPQITAPLLFRHFAESKPGAPTKLPIRSARHRGRSSATGSPPDAANATPPSTSTGPFAPSSSNTWPPFSSLLRWGP